MKRFYYFLLFLCISVTVFGGDVHDAELEGHKREQLTIKNSILQSAIKVAEDQKEIKRALIGCRRECDYCKDKEPDKSKNHKFDVDENVDSGCSIKDGGTFDASLDYACERQQKCIKEKYQTGIKAENDFLGKDNKRHEFDQKAFLKMYNTVVERIVGPVESSKKDLYKKYVEKRKKQPSYPEKWPLKSDNRKSESVLFAAFRQRPASSVLEYLRSDASPRDKLAFVSIPHSDVLSKYSNEKNKLELMEDQIRRTYFYDKTGCYGDDECYKKYRKEKMEDKMKLPGVSGSGLEDVYRALREHYLEELSIDSLSIFATIQEEHLNGKFYKKPAITVNKKWGGSYLDDILYNTQLMQAVCAQTAMEMLVELRVLEMTMAQLLFEADINLAIHPSYMDEFQKDDKPLGQHYDEEMKKKGINQ